MTSLPVPAFSPQPTPREGVHSLREWRALRAAVGDSYRIIEPIASGGMGTVYLARERVLERNVAIKVLPLDQAHADDVARFRREARVMASLDHAGIVAVHAFGQSHGLAWFAMTFVAGGTLADRIADGRRVTPRDATLIIEQLAAALAAAHRRGVVHGDVKPENVLCADDTRVLLADFGVATVLSSDHSRSEIVKRRGTPHYMSPEQIAGEDLDGRSDVYALGVLAFRLLSGQTLFAGDSSAVAAQHVASAPPPLATVAPWVPADLAAVVHRCLEKSPAARWRSMDELAAALAETRRGVRPSLRAWWIRLSSLPGRLIAR